MKCIEIRKDGNRCNANAMHESDYCYLHNPSISKNEKYEAQGKGGKSHKAVVAQPLQQLQIYNVSDVTGLLIDTINNVRCGIVDIRVANCIGYLSGHLIKAFELSDMEKRLSELESKLQKI